MFERLDGRGMAAVPLVVVAVLFFAMARCGGDGAEHRGTVLTADRAGPAGETGSWRLRVLLPEGRSIAGSDEVVIGAAAGALRCLDGTAAGTRVPVPGGEVRFTRQGAGVDGSHPPGIGARDVRVACTDRPPP